jgi:hypothetical protein
VIDGEIDHRGVDHSHVDDVQTGGENAVDQCAGQSGRVRPHVAADDDRVLALHLLLGGQRLAAALEELAGGVAHFPGDFLVQRIGVGGANVISLENAIQHCEIPFFLTPKPMACREGQALLESIGAPRSSTSGGLFWYVRK